MTSRHLPPSWLATHLGLASTVSPLNVAALLSSAALAISFLVFLNAAQPFLLDLLNLPSDQSGAVTGRLILFDQLASLSLALLWGAAADRVGIRVVIPLGYGLVGLGLAAYASATSVGQLLPFRLIFAVSHPRLST